MKKIIIAAALILTTGILSSQTTKKAIVKPTAIVEQNSFSFRKDVGTAD